MALQTYLAVAAGGAVGAMGRFAVGGVSLRLMGPGFPWGTLAVNVLGAFLIGTVTMLLAQRFQASHILQAGLVTGVLGGFTTFSAFSLEAALMVERHQWGLAAGYAMASVVLCVAAVFAGMALVRTVL
ncbi:MAG: fluoride efflux transporter CrcB [Alphaproteobacteria bacterium]